MVQFKLSVLFILAVAAIAPVAALPIPASDNAAAGPSNQVKHQSVQSPVASLATQYKDGRDSLMDGHSPKSEHNESDSHDKGKQPEIRVNSPESPSPSHPQSSGHNAGETSHDKPESSTPSRIPSGNPTGNQQVGIKQKKDLTVKIPVKPPWQPATRPPKSPAQSARTPTSAITNRGSRIYASQASATSPLSSRPGPPPDLYESKDTTNLQEVKKRRRNITIYEKPPWKP